ncbi:MAG: hypothetical protein WBD40_15325 [Tepidisphaeraceae bacterium]
MGEIIKVNCSVPAPQRSAGEPSSWTQKYGDTHRMKRVANWPEGVEPLKKVRLYRRGDHWLCQWWEPSERKNVSQSVVGDVITAIAAAREIDRRLVDSKRSGRGGAAGHGKLKHAELVDRFLADLERRSNAKEVVPATVGRYRAALAHYTAYADTADVHRRYAYAAEADRTFALGFASFLASRQVRANGRAGAKPRTMHGGGFVWDAARAMFCWAIDPDRGGVLPEAMRNPFLRKGSSARKPAADPFGEPDVTIAMAKELLEACDDYQLRLFAPMLFFGLRAAEPVFLAHEYLDEQWLRVPCNENLGYVTKGKRDKRFPLAPPLKALLKAAPTSCGLLYLGREVHEGRRRPKLTGVTLDRLEQTYAARCEGLASAQERLRQRDQIVREAGGIGYDEIEGEFRALAATLKWPKSATLKDLRHLFSTSLANAGVAEPYRQYFMGHAPSSAVISAYTHVNKLSAQYAKLLDTEYAPLLEVLQRRAQRLRRSAAA